jgi:hypothetical protein
VRIPGLSQWLVPALGCFLLVFATLSNRFPARPDLGEFALTPEGVMLASRGDHCGVNRLPTGRLEWSFGSRSSTSVLGSILVSHTNRIIQ